MKKPSANVQDGFYRTLYDNYEELSGFLRSALDSLDQYTEELRYLYDFIHYQELDDEYRYFRENAHEDMSQDLPFPSLVL